MLPWRCSDVTSFNKSAFKGVCRPVEEKTFAVCCLVFCVSLVTDSSAVGLFSLGETVRDGGTYKIHGYPAYPVSLSHVYVMMTSQSSQFPESAHSQLTNSLAYSIMTIQLS